MKAFIPKNLFAIAQDGKKKRVLFVDCYLRNGDFYTEQYYNRNFAVHKRMTPEELSSIEKVKSSDDSISLYQEVFA